MNLVQLEFKLNYYNVQVQHVNHYTRETLQANLSGFFYSREYASKLKI